MKALLIIDMQQGIFGPNDISIPNAPTIVHNTNILIEKAIRTNTPIIVVQHHTSKGGLLEFGSENWKTHPQLNVNNPELIIHKDKGSAFHGTTLQQELTERGITELIICGLQTEYCIDSTCRNAYTLGYSVTLVKDGHGTLNYNHLPANKIIEHHNIVLSDYFPVVNTNEIAM